MNGSTDGKSQVRIRTGTPHEVPALLALYDQAVEWLVASGRPGQWGTRPWSQEPTLVRRVQRFADSGEMRVAEVGDALVGAMRLGAAPRYVPPAREPELFLDAFVIDRRCTGQGIGRALLEHARAEAAQAGVKLLRLDCWAGGDQALVRYYERAGFVQTERFRLDHVLDGWEGAILVQRLHSSSL
jgi:GNAT superfamily N-acetyltransferase